MWLNIEKIIIYNRHPCSVFMKEFISSLGPAPFFFYEEIYEKDKFFYLLKMLRKLKTKCNKCGQIKTPYFGHSKTFLCQECCMEGFHYAYI